MPVNIPDGYFQVTVIGTQTDADGEIMNVFGVRDTTDQGAQACADLVASLWMDDFGDFYHTSYTAQSVHVASEPPGPVADQVINENGTVGGDPTASSLAGLIHKTTGFSGRRNRGRMYIGPTGIANTEGNNLTSGGLAQLAASAEAFLIALEAGDFPMVILHTNNAVPSLVTAVDASQRLATQRGRLRN